MDEFIEWYCSEPRLSLNKTVVLFYRVHLESRQLAPGTINLRLGPGIRPGKIFRRGNRAGYMWGDGMLEKVVWHVVKGVGGKSWN
jgi:hypothetical protein